MKVLGVSGSLQAASANLSLLQAAKELAPAGVEVLLFDGIRDLPLFNPDLAAVKARIVGGAPIARGPRAEAELKSLLEKLVAAHAAGMPGD